MEHDTDWPAINRWHAAIGKFIVAGANLEGAVGTLLYAIEQGRTDRFYPRTMESLIKGCRRGVPTVVDADMAGRLDALLVELVAFKDARNDVIHGWWRIGRDGKDAIRGRASPQAPEMTIAKVTFHELSGMLARAETLRVSVLDLAEEFAGAAARREATNTD